MQELQWLNQDVGRSEETGLDLSFLPQSSSAELIPWTKVDHPRRRFRRWSVNMSAVIVADGVKHNCGIHNISPAGARISLTKGDSVAIGSEVVLELKDFGPVKAAIQYEDSTYYGLMFLLDTAESKKLTGHLDTLRAADADAGAT